MKSPGPSGGAICRPADASSTGASGTDASRADASGADASRADASRTGASRADASGTGVSSAGACSADASSAGASTTPDAGPGAAWYVIATKRHRESVARSQLRQRGVASYLPRVIQWPRPIVGSDIGPMFPGYLFVRATLPDQFYMVTWTPGVKGFVTFGEEPVPIDASVVEFLRGREGPDGIIRCGEPLPARTEVRIVRGPLQGLTAVVEQRMAARERVRVLMTILQRETRVELPERWVRQL